MREYASVGFDSHTPPPTLLRNCSFNQLPQHRCTSFRRNQTPPIFAVNWNNAQSEFIVALVQGLSESFGAGQEAQSMPERINARDARYSCRSTLRAQLLKLYLC